MHPAPQPCAGRFLVHDLFAGATCLGRLPLPQCIDGGGALIRRQAEGIALKVR